MFDPRVWTGALLHLTTVLLWKKVDPCKVLDRQAAFHFFCLCWDYRCSIIYPDKETERMCQLWSEPRFFAAFMYCTWEIVPPDLDQVLHASFQEQENIWYMLYFPESQMIILNFSLVAGLHKEGFAQRGIHLRTATDAYNLDHNKANQTEDLFGLTSCQSIISSI